VLQAIDVGLAAPVKTHFKKKMTHLLKGESDLDLSGHQHAQTLKKACADEMRHKSVASFLHATEAGCTSINIKAAFKKSGLYPFDPERALKSQFIAESKAMEQLLGQRPKIPPNLHPFVEENHRMLSNDEGLAAFAAHVLKRPPTPEELTLDAAMWQDIMERGRVTRGKHNVSLTGMRRMLVAPAGEVDGPLHIICDHH
jgi:hypothetical protein